MFALAMQSTMVGTDSMGQDEVADFLRVSRLSRQNSGSKQWHREQNPGPRIPPSYEMLKFQVCIFFKFNGCIKDES